jgi:hypothetical protein
MRGWWARLRAWDRERTARYERAWRRWDRRAEWEAFAY